MSSRYDFITQHFHFDHQGEKLKLKQLTYDDGNAALVIVDNVGQPYAKLSVNVPEVTLGKNEYVIKTYSENFDVAKDIYKQGWFDDTGRRVRSGFVEMPVWKWRHNEWKTV